MPRPSAPTPWQPRTAGMRARWIRAARASPSPRPPRATEGPLPGHPAERTRGRLGRALLRCPHRPPAAVRPRAQGEGQGRAQQQALAAEPAPARGEGGPRVPRQARA
eukprot:15448584-Alexandrium_andersonii.AAC.1